VIDLPGLSLVPQAGGQFIQQSIATIGGLQQQSSTVGAALALIKPFLLVRPERNRPAGKDKLQYPAKSSVRMSSSSMPALTSISFMPATMAGGPAL
jgi:hypothetical protein